MSVLINRQCISCIHSEVTQWIKDNAVFIKEMAKMLEEADTAESEEV